MKLKRKLTYSIFQVLIPFYCVFLFFRFTYFRPDFGRFLRFWTNPGIQDGGPSHGRHSEMTMQSLRHVTSSPHDVDAKGDILRRTIYPPSFVVIVLYSRSYGGGGVESAPLPSGRRRPKEKPGLSRDNFRFSCVP